MYKSPIEICLSRTLESQVPSILAKNATAAGTELSGPSIREGNQMKNIGIIAEGHAFQMREDG